MNTRFLALIISILLVVGVAAPAESQLTAYYSKYDTISARSDSNTVIVWDGSDVLDFVTGGSLALSISASQVVTYSGALTVGVDDTGYDVTFYGASAGAYFLWDESADLLDLRGKTAEGAGTLRLTTGETTVVDGNVLGRVDFLAPLEASGTDAILVAASIIAEADDTFGAALNDADLVFALAESETAAERIRFSYDGSATAITTGAATTISTGGNNAMTLTSGTAAHTITAGDLTLYDDNNNADVSVKLGTSATEALTIQVLNGAANKSAESVNIVSSTAAGGANAGQITIGVDDATILTIDDSGINAVLGATTPAAATVTTLTASSGGSLTGTWTDLGTITTADINGGTVDGVTIGASSAPTVTDLGSVATADINGGTLDGVTIGGASAAAATVTTFTSTGIDDNATGEILQITDSGATVAGDFSATDLDGILGSNTAAAATVTTFTSTGIDDNATGEILQITDSGATVAGDFSATDLDGILGSNAPAAANVTTLSATGATSFLGAAGSIVHTVGQNGGGSTNQYYQMISEQYDAAETEGFQIMETFSNGTNNQIVIGGGSADYNAANLIYFYTGANDATRTGTSRMVIDGSGNVGIGTASPDGTLHVHTATCGSQTAASDYDDLTIENSGIGGISILTPAANNGAVVFGDPDGQTQGFLQYLHSSDAMQIGTSGAEAIRIDSSGNVGIGGSAPAALLDVRDGEFHLTDADVVHGLTVQAPTNTYGRFMPLSGTAGGLRIRGVSDTDVQGLHLNGVIGSTDPTDTYPAVYITGAKSNGTTSSAALGAAETVLQVINNTTELVTVLGSGNVGIGDTTPDATLDVEVADATGDGGYACTISNLDTDNGNGLYIKGGDDANVIALGVHAVGGQTLFHVKGNGDVTIGGNKTQDLAAVGTAWDDVCGDDFQNEGDWPIFDDRNDLEALMALRPSATRYDSTQQYRIIDDNTLPEWIKLRHDEDFKHVYREAKKVRHMVVTGRVDTMLAPGDSVLVDSVLVAAVDTTLKVGRDTVEVEDGILPVDTVIDTLSTVPAVAESSMVQKEGEIVRDPHTGNPWLSLKAMNAWALGSIKELNLKFEAYKDSMNAKAAERDARIATLEAKVAALEGGR